MSTDPSTLTSEEIVGLTIIGEARGEPIQGQVAVGCVIRNRLYKHPTTYKSYVEVCLAPKQFSCWNENDPNRALLIGLADKMIDGQLINDIYIRQCLLVAKGIINWDILDNTKGAENYMTHSLFYSIGRPKWAKFPLLTPEEIGDHVFFNV